ncbi:hypothetical protein GCM10008090_30800 [Arenicella chitinivorans]|uniref:Radical SAM protein n=1 Tax=Arenicella chitinivorans TaxID=1329800 RepID=A0A918S039_9GAMM|nr:hypothetical protein GCM10008090_30800 [Arenicella chitinivorans]
MQKTAQRILEHNQFHQKEYTSIIYHGGEPMLGGCNHIEMVTSILKSTLEAEGIDCRFGMQSNGLLFNEEMGDLMLKLGLRTGISIDGPPHINDRFRVDHKGRGSGQKLHERLQLLTSAKYKKLLSGFLCVVDLDNDPIEIYEYLRCFNPPSMDFLLPYDNWHRLPYKFDQTGTNNLYADWFIRLFDHWIEDKNPIPIRTFDSMLRIMFGGKSLVESMGVEPVDLVVVETDGAIEAVDSLKAAKDGITDLSLNVFNNSFNEAANHSSVVARQLGAKSLAEKCRSCDLVNICGGGIHSNKIFQGTGFQQPKRLLHES